MKAAIYKKYGPPSVIKFANVPKPDCGAKDILVKVHYTTVNRTDTGLRSANYVISRAFTGLLRPKHQIQGCEFAGEVVAIGEDVTNFNKGDKVFGFDDEGNGGHAEYKAIRADKMVATIPANFNYKQAAPASEGAHYMLAYMRAAKVGKGTKVLVNGGTGAIGSAAVQIMSSLGAEVAATCRKKHLKLVKDLGAHKVVDYVNEDYTDLEETFDVVFDSVGKSSFKEARKVLKKNGIYMSSELGDYGQNPLLAIRSKFYGKQKVLFPLPKNDKKDLLYLKKLIEDGSFTPLVEKTYPFKDIVAATEYAESGQKVGNIVIKMES